jgi:Transmembrane protein of unknown function (DUF3556)
MGFLRADLPQIDVAQWRQGTRSERIRPMARHLAERGFGTPDAIHHFHVVKIGLYILGGIGFALATKGIDGWTNIGTWWREPIVFEKAVLWSLLFEVLGLGCGFGPLNNRFFPPIGSPLYWLRPGTIRLAPWPNRVPLTKGDTRTPADAVLYGLLLVATIVALLSDGTGPDASLHTAVGVISMWKIAVIVGLLAVIGLRDKVVFLATRGEVYGTLTVTFLFPAVDMIVAAKLVMVIIWVGAATSKFNKHFPFVISTMMSNSPVLRPKWMKRLFFERFPDDLRPGRVSRIVAHGATFIEFTAPLVMLFSHGGIPTAVAATAMVLFHLGILSAIPMGVPLEWNVFMIFGVLTLFVDKAGIGITDLKHPVPVAILIAVVLGTVILGNLFPRKISFLPGMRYYAGNWDTTLWCVTKSADEKIEKDVIKIASMPQAQLKKYYGAEQAEIPVYLGYAFRAMNTHGRALFTLANRAIPPGRESEYTIVDGERICSTAVGWNFGDGHMHNEQLVAALQRRCHFEPGEVRIVMLDAQPIHRQTQEYRLVDAATGEFERGLVKVADMVTRQPWADDVPVRLYDATTVTR